MQDALLVVPQCLQQSPPAQTALCSLQRSQRAAPCSGSFTDGVGGSGAPQDVEVITSGCTERSFQVSRKGNRSVLSQLSLWTNQSSVCFHTDSDKHSPVQQHAISPSPCQQSPLEQMLSRKTTPIPEEMPLDEGLFCPKSAQAVVIFLQLLFAFNESKLCQVLG